MRRFPPTGAGWILIAAAAVPVVIKAAKPLAKFIGEELEKIGKGIRESAAEASTTAPKEEPVKAGAASAATETVEKPSPKARKAPQAKPKATVKSATKQGSKTVKSSKSGRRNGPNVETG